mmetsp:Transcript_5107/g.12205  ORF Transcript_5107/g.12205 Transcript_5107/m.12205 type:complete len:289 (+) Transcript_5107:331-1197(+)
MLPLRNKVRYLQRFDYYEYEEEIVGDSFEPMQSRRSIALDSFQRSLRIISTHNTIHITFVVSNHWSPALVEDHVIRIDSKRSHHALPNGAFHDRRDSPVGSLGGTLSNRSIDVVLDSHGAHGIHKEKTKSLLWVHRCRLVQGQRVDTSPVEATGRHLGNEIGGNKGQESHDLPLVFDSQDSQQYNKKERPQNVGGKVPPGNVGAGSLVFSLGTVEFLAMLFRFLEVVLGSIDLALEAFHRAERALVGVLFEHHLVRQQINYQLPKADRQDDTRNVRCRHGCCLFCLVR